MTRLICIVVLLAGCLTCPSLLAEETKVDQMRRVGIESRGAAIRQTLNLPGENASLSGYGVFISPDGLALFNSGLFATRTKPRFFDAAGKELKFGAVLAVFPDQELLLMKFDHKPRVWRPVAEDEPKRGDYVSIVVLEKGETPEESSVPPMVARMFAVISRPVVNYQVPRVTQVLEVGCHSRFEQVRLMRPGTYAVDRNGHLVGFQAGTGLGGNKVFHLYSLRGLQELIGQAVEAGTKVPFPLPNKEVLTDRATLDPDYSRMERALRQNDLQEADVVLGRLRDRYPQSRVVRRFASAFVDPGNPAAPPLPAVDDTDAFPIRVQAHLDRAFILRHREDWDGVLREVQAIIRLTPDGSRNPATAEIVDLLLQRGMLNEAEAFLTRACEVEPDDLELLMGLKLIQQEQQKLEGLDATTKRIAKLEQWYPEN